MSRKLSFLALAIFALALAVMLPQALATTTATPNSLYVADLNSVRFLPSTIHSGDTVSVAIDIKNQGTTVSMDNVVASLEVGSYFDPVTTTASIDSISPSATQTAILTFRVKDTTPPGFYQTFLTLSYQRTDPSGSSTDVNQSETISVPVSAGQKNITVDVNPKVLNPGTPATLTFSVTNMGSTPVSSVLLSWNEATALILPLGSDNRKFVSTINPGETVDLNYSAAADPNITTGLYSLNVNLSYNDSTGTQTQSSVVGIVVGGATDFDVSSDYASNQLSFSIANVGSNNAGAVVVKLSPQPGLSVSGSNTVIIGALNKGDYSIANFTVQSLSDANAGGGFRRGAGAIAGTGASQGTTGASTTGAAAAGGAVATGAPQGQAGNNYTVEIDYTDTTGTRQVVHKNFQLSARTTGFPTAGAAAGGGRGSDTTLLAILFAVIVVAGIVYNKFRAKKNWKHFAIITVVAVAVPVLVVLFAPQALSTTILAVVVLAGSLIGFLAVMGKPSRLGASPRN